jgi:hypothetical protein
MRDVMIGFYNIGKELQQTERDILYKISPLMKSESGYGHRRWLVDLQAN